MKLALAGALPVARYSKRHCMSDTLACPSPFMSMVGSCLPEMVRVTVRPTSSSVKLSPFWVMALTSMGR